MGTVLAHGALGVFDELVFAGVAVIFIVMMAVSFIRSRNIDPETEDTGDPLFAADEPEAPDHFRLD